MTIINTSGLAIFGPGSEWLWTMAQFLALAITGLAIFRQLRAQSWANQLAVLRVFAEEFLAERMIRQKLQALIELAEGNRRLTPALDHVGGWFDGVADARYNGHLRPDYAAQEWGLVSQIYWAIVSPILPELRAADPGLWKSWERWLGEVRALEAKAGVVHDLSPERLARWVPETIEYYIARLRIELEMKSGVIPTWPIPQSASAAAAAE